MKKCICDTILLKAVRSCYDDRYPEYYYGSCPDLSDTGSTQGWISLQFLVHRKWKIQSCINGGELGEFEMCEMCSWFAMDLGWKPSQVLNDKFLLFDISQ